MSKNESFPLGGSSLDEIKKIIEGYAHLGDKANNKSVGIHIGMDSVQVSRNNAFLTEVGLLEDAGTWRRRRATPLGAKLGYAIREEDSETIRNCWRRVIKESEFLSEALSVAEYRTSLPREDLQRILVEKAGKEWKIPHIAGAAACIDILVEAGFFRDSGGQLISSTDEPHPTAPLSTADIDKLPIRKAIREIVDTLLQDAICAHRAEAYIAATLLYRSIIEGILLGLLLGNRKRAMDPTGKAVPKPRGVVPPVEEWKLDQMIQRAVAMGLCDATDERSLKTLQEYGNLVHPSKALREKPFRGTPDMDAQIVCSHMIKLLTRYGAIEES